MGEKANTTAGRTERVTHCRNCSGYRSLLTRTGHVECRVDQHKSIYTRTLFAQCPLRKGPVTVTFVLVQSPEDQ